MRPHRSHAPTLSSRSTSRTSSNGGGRRPRWMPAAESSGGGSSSTYPSQAAGEVTHGHDPPGTNNNGGGGNKKAAIWTAASPIYAQRKRRRSLVTGATRLIWVGLGLTVVSEMRGFVGTIWWYGDGDNNHDGSSSSTTGNGNPTHGSSGNANAGYGRPAAPRGLGGRYGRQASDIGLESRHAKKAGNNDMKGGGGGATKYDKDPLADDDWSPNEAPAGIDAIGGGVGGIHGSNSNGGVMNAASPLVGGAGGGMPPPPPPPPMGRTAGTAAIRGMGSNTGNTNAMGGFNGFNPNANDSIPIPAATTTQAIGRDAVKVTTRTTTLGGETVSKGNGQVGNFWEQHLKSNAAADGTGTSNGAVNDKPTGDSAEVKSLQEKLKNLEGKLLSFMDGKENTDGKTTGDETSDEGKYLRGGAKSGQKTAVSNVNDDPLRQKTSAKDGLDCSRYGGLDDDEILSDLVYWKDTHEGFSVVSPFHPTIKATAQDGGAAVGNGGGLSRRYLTFEVDVHAGFNRNRMQFETMVALAWAMGRILVLPPKWSLWPHEAGMANYNSFDDYYDLDTLTKRYVGVDIVPMEVFLTTEAAAGRFQAEGGGKFLDGRSIALGIRSLQPPSGKVDWNGDADISMLFEYLEKVALTPAWDFDMCIAAFPKSGIGSANMELSKLMNGIVRRSDGRPMPNPQSFQGKPTAVDAPPVERLREVMGKRELLCFYDEPMQEANVIHFRLAGAKGDAAAKSEDRGPGHWYSSIFFEDHKHDLFVKRLMRDGLRYNDEIQCAAAKVIKGIRQIAVSNPKKTNDKDEVEKGEMATYNALHLRRFRHSHEEAVLSPSDIGAAVSERFGDSSVLYVATDSKGDETDLLDRINKSVKIVALRNFIGEIAKVDPKYYGMIDQVVASRGEKFVGTFHSSFTNGINRFRGYHTQKVQQLNQNGAIDSFYAAPKGKEGDMRVYKALSKPFHAREYPLAWRSIDVGLDVAKPI